MSAKPCILSLRASPKSGPVLARPMTPGDAARIEIASEVTFYAHGFNVDQSKGALSIDKFTKLLDLSNANVNVSVLWPGDHWLRALSYPFEGPDADLSGYELSKFVLTQVRPDAKVNFVAHSLGSRVVMHAVRRLESRRRPVANVCLMAAAIDADSVATWEVYRSAALWADHVAVLSSVEDEVLRLAYPAGDLLQAIGFRVDTPGFALGFRGPRPYRDLAVPENIHHEPIDKKRNSNHGHYFPGDKKKPSKAETDNQKSAAKFTESLLRGDPTPKYP